LVRAIAVAFAAAACAVGLAWDPAPAWAHNELRSSDPADGAALASAPTQVMLAFAERLDQKYTQINVTDRAETSVVAGEPAVTGNRAVQRLGALTAGEYTVGFRVVSVDGHPVQGSVTFTLTAPTAASTPPAAVTPTPAADPATPTSGPGSVAATPVAETEPGAGGAGSVAVVLIAAVAAIGVAAALLRRRRGTPPS